MATFVLSSIVVIFFVIEVSWCGVVSLISPNNFEWKLFQNGISAVESNAVISLFSIRVVMSLAAEAVENDSEASEEMECLIPDLANLYQYRRSMIETLRSMQQRASSNELNLATRIYMQNGYEIDKIYDTIIRSYYESDVKNLDLENRKESAKTINDWCSNVTNNNLNNFIKEEDLEETKLLIINAVYFKSEWKFPFDPRDKSIFRLDSGKTIEVDYMFQTGEFFYHYSQRHNAQILALPYKTQNFSMVFLLPSGKEKLSDFFQRIDWKIISEMESSMEETRVDVTIPKFKFEYSADIKNILQKLNVTALFSDRTEFPGLGDRLKISKIVQKAGISLDEKGSEAYAATEIGIGIRIGGLTFDASRSFVFYLKDFATKRILFAGKVLKPTF